MPHGVRRLSAARLTPRLRVKPGWAWQLLTLPMLLFILLPLVALFTRTSPREIAATLNLKQVQQAVSLSLVTSLVTVVITLAFGTPLAYYLSRPGLRLYRLVDTLVDLPTVLPPSVAGVALLLAFGRQGLAGRWLGVQIPFTTLAVIMAQTFIAAPFYIKAAAIGFASIDPELKQAAALDGAGRWQVFRHITAPLAWMGMVSGLVMTWARALGEFGATILFAGNFPGRTQTMPLAIYLGFEVDLNVAVTLSIILVVFSFVVLILLKTFLQHRIEIPERRVSTPAESK